MFFKSSDFDRFSYGARHYFSYIGVRLVGPQSTGDTANKSFATLLMVILMMHMIDFVATTKDINELSAAIGYVTYYFVGLGKGLSMFHNSDALRRNHALLQQFYPRSSSVYERRVRPYLRIYERVEQLLSKFFIYLLVMYLMLSLVVSLQEMLGSGQFGYKLPVPLRSPLPVESNIFVYALYFIVISVGSFHVGVTILSADLCLYNSVAQLCLHFEILADNILQLQPDKPETLQKLKRIAAKHQEILNLCSHVNRIFSPSIIFSLSASSFIMCFVSYQLLDDVPYVFYARAFLLVLYESKQPMITCYYGNKLMDASSNIFDTLYMHDWYKGDPKYRRFVLYMMMHTLKPITLNVAGVADVSMITLKQVFSTSYQAFAVLKNA